jgi:diguanylate cyclase (GGDEF)-like protein
MAGRHRRRVAGDSGGAADTEAWSVFLRYCGALDPTPDLALDRWITGLRRTGGAAITALALCDAPRRFVKSCSSEDGKVHGLTELDPSESLRVHLLSQAGRGGYIEAPVTVAGLVVGHVAAAGEGPGGWPPHIDELVRDTAAAVSTHLALRLAESETERVRQLVSSHHHIHDMIARAAPLPEIFTAICETIANYDATLMPSVLLLNQTSSTLHSGVGPALPAAYLAATEGVVIGPNIGTCGPAAWFGELTISRDVAEDPRWAPILELAKLAGISHCWSTPIKGAAGEVLGTLACYGRQPRDPLPEHLALMEDWSRVAGIAIERSRSLERLTYDARHDGLTGLPNRVAIFEELDEAIQRAGPEAAVAVLFVDLDGLKALNDTLGHDRADEMIREIALRMSKTVGEDGFVGRFGGDEFIVIVEGLPGHEPAGDLGARLLEAVAQPLPGVDSVIVTASIGIGLIRSNSVEAREAIRRSDAAMYEAKRLGRDRCVYADIDHGDLVGRRLRLTRLLRGAETRGELSLLFQPIIALPSLDIIGVEALLRWTNPGFGEVSPSEFVPIAEDTGSIVPIGAWVLRESCEAMARLAEQGHELDLGVNVSARQVASPDFPLWVRQTLWHAQFPASRLNLEITETALMNPDAATANSLRELDTLGIGLILDDFGTGYSSLSWLKQRRFSAIKIDHSFIRGLPNDRGDRAIVGGVIDMAKALGCTVTAEGVETQGQLDTLETLGCDRVQGFLLMEPVPEAALIRLLNEAVQQSRVSYM